jgi:hypothetical protein
MHFSSSKTWNPSSEYIISPYFQKFQVAQANTSIKHGPYKFIFESLPDHPTMHHIWKSKCLPKLRVFVWLLIMDRLNTKYIMSRKHWHVDGSLNCVLCNLNVRETRDYLFFDYPFVSNCWNQLNIVWNNNLLISTRIFQTSLSATALPSVLSY